MKEKKTVPIPAGFTEEDIRIESSICTGERTVGFYDRQSRRLMYAELVRTESDIDGFYQKYGLSRKK